MRFLAEQHAYDQMQARGVTHIEIEEALTNIKMHVFTPKNSTRIEGVTLAGRTIKIWIAGTKWPPHEPVRIKTVAPRGRST